jgi:hypothetical protein
MSSLNVSFMLQEREDAIRSRLEGRTVKVMVECKKIRFPGSPDFLIETVTETDRQSPEYRAWKENRSLGTPLSTLLDKPMGEGVVTPETVDELRAAGVATVENLAHVPDSAKGIPMLVTLRRLALDVLESNKAAAAAEVVARRDSEADALRGQVASLEAKIARLTELLEPKEDARA